MYTVFLLFIFFIMQIYSTDSFPLNAPVYIVATDTCYGFCARYNDIKSLQLIAQIKQRSIEQMFSLVMSDMKMIETFCMLNADQKKYIRESGDIPMTYILHKKPLLGEYFPSISTVAVRKENNNFPIHIAKILGTPCTTTSVNIHGSDPLYCKEDILKEFQNNPLMKEVVFVDSGKLSLQPPSTIMDLTQCPYKKIR
jgi:L-threonylcarbamoyladenylate synthase